MDEGSSYNYEEEYDFMSCESRGDEFQTAQGSQSTGFSDLGSPASHSAANAMNFDHNEFSLENHSGQALGSAHVGTGYYPQHNPIFTPVSNYTDDYRVVSLSSSGVPDMVMDDSSVSRSHGLWGLNSEGFQEGLTRQQGWYDVENGCSSIPTNDVATNYAGGVSEQYSRTHQYLAPHQITYPTASECRYDGMVDQMDTDGAFSPEDRIYSDRPWNHLSVLGAQQEILLPHHAIHHAVSGQAPPADILHRGQSSSPKKRRSKTSKCSNAYTSSDLTESTMTLRPLTSGNLTQMEQSIPDILEDICCSIPFTVTKPTHGHADNDMVAADSSRSVTFALVRNFADFRKDHVRTIFQ